MIKNTSQNLTEVKEYKGLGCLSKNISLHLRLFIYLCWCQFDNQRARLNFRRWTILQGQLSLDASQLLQLHHRGSH